MTRRFGAVFALALALLLSSISDLVADSSEPGALHHQGKNGAAPFVGPGGSPLNDGSVPGDDDSPLPITRFGGPMYSTRGADQTYRNDLYQNSLAVRRAWEFHLRGYYLKFLGALR